MKKTRRWRLSMISFASLGLLLSVGCQKTGTQVKQAEKQPELLKEPYKNEEFATGTYVQVMIYDKNNHEILEAIKNVDTKPFGGYLKSFK